MNPIISRTVNYTDVTVYESKPNKDAETRDALPFTCEAYTLQYDKPLRNADVARRAVKSYLGHENFAVTSLKHYSGHYELSSNWFFLNAKPLNEYKPEYLKRVRIVKASIGETTIKVVTPEILASGEEPVSITYDTDLKPRALKKLVSSKIGTTNYMVMETTDATTEFAMPLSQFVQLATEYVEWLETHESDTTDESTDTTTDESANETDDEMADEN